MDGNAIETKANELGTWDPHKRYSYMDIISRCDFFIAKKNKRLQKVQKLMRRNQELHRKCNVLAAQDIVHRPEFDVLRKRLVDAEQRLIEIDQGLTDKQREWYRREIAIKRQKIDADQRLTDRQQECYEREIAINQQKIELESKCEELWLFKEKLRYDQSKWLQETKITMIVNRVEEMIKSKNSHGIIRDGGKAEITTTDMRSERKSGGLDDLVR
jgi:hypothetical protein